MTLTGKNSFFKKNITIGNRIQTNCNKDAVDLDLDLTQLIYFYLGKHEFFFRYFTVEKARLSVVFCWCLRSEISYTPGGNKEFGHLLYIIFVRTKIMTHESIRKHFHH